MSAKRTSILFTEDSLPLGGAENVLLRRLECLDRRRFDVHLVTLRAEGRLLAAAQERAEHFACVRRAGGLDPRAVRRLRTYVVQHAIAIVNTNQWLDSLYVLLACRRLRVRKVATVHGYDHTWRHAVNLRVLRHFERIICVSRSMRLDFFRMGIPWSKLAVVPNSCDAGFRPPAEDIACPEPGRPFRIVSVAHFRWARDPATLLRALELLEARGIAVELHIAGEGDTHLKTEFEAHVAAAGMSARVTLWGERVVDAEWLRGFDLFAFTSLADTFGIAVLEAMACGVPVLVSDIPPLMELIGYGQFGAYFEAGNAESCAGAIAALMHDPERRQALARAGPGRAEDFAPATTTRALEQVYDDVLGDGVSREVA
ncbi:MAG: glycosyltransferase family 4 protein [Gemmatimonadaceae bacterium]